MGQTAALWAGRGSSSGRALVEVAEALGERSWAGVDGAHPRHSGGTQPTPAPSPSPIPVPGATVQTSFCSSAEAQTEQSLLCEVTLTLCLEASWTLQPLPQFPWCGVLHVGVNASRVVLGCKSDHATSRFGTSHGSHLPPLNRSNSSVWDFMPGRIWPHGPPLFVSLRSPLSSTPPSLLGLALCFLNCGYRRCNAHCVPFN